MVGVQGSSGAAGAMLRADVAQPANNATTSRSPSLSGVCMRVCPGISNACCQRILERLQAPIDPRRQRLPSVYRLQHPGRQGHAVGWSREARRQPIQARRDVNTGELMRIGAEKQQSAQGLTVLDDLLPGGKPLSGAADRGRFVLRQLDIGLDLSQGALRLRNQQSPLRWFL